RKYPHQSLAAHLLGYDGEITERQLNATRSQGYKLGDEIRQAGIEASLHKDLRGRAAVGEVADPLRRPATEHHEPKTLPQAGKTIRLTLDLGVQRAAEQALRYGIRVAHDNQQWAADGGAIVALDPRDGAVLAMASYPTYQPSVYVSRDPSKLAPLENRQV